MAGRAAEAMLRALLWHHDRQQGIGHDLRRLLKRVGLLGMLQNQDRDVLLDHVQEVALLWHNDLRFAGDDAFVRHLAAVGRTRRLYDGRQVRGNAAKANAQVIVNLCENIVRRGELVWQRSRSK